MNIYIHSCSNHQITGVRSPTNTEHRSSMSHSANAANRIKQEAGFPSRFPDDNLILAGFNDKELYNPKSKHDSSRLPLVAAFPPHLPRAADLAETEDTLERSAADSFTSRGKPSLFRDDNKQQRPSSPSEANMERYSGYRACES
ncbi:hypothetical protein EYF80_048412 [Liparis tanakae]|uniref:Uncharacterized protein n=1 Tax=Liparis tanakae TaxID=230148 RepID=A0A4Z2FJM9_9TELE|nr:hypothetical protein EYF80_048412 [Liparis tanakae]